MKYTRRGHSSDRTPKCEGPQQGPRQRLLALDCMILGGRHLFLAHDFQEGQGPLPLAGRGTSRVQKERQPSASGMACDLFVRSACCSVCVTVPLAGDLKH